MHYERRFFKTNVISKLRASFYLLVAGCALVSLCIVSLQQPGPVRNPPQGLQWARRLSDVVETPLDGIQDYSDADLLGHFDASGRYKIVPYVMVAEDWQQLAKGALCVAVQSSLDRADNLVNQTAVWQGAVSFAMLAPGPEFPLAMAYLNYLRRCVPAVRNQVSVHLAYPVRRPPTPTTRELEEWVLRHYDCTTEASVALRSLLRLRDRHTVKWRSDLQYPQNVLRNVARDRCSNQWVTCIDIDMLLPPGTTDPHVPSITQRLNTFLKSQNSELTAFVFPVFEVATTQPRLPASKTELRALVAAKQARQYHVELFSANQELSQLKRWLTIKPSNNYNTVSVAFPVDKFKFFYEPVYIAPRGTPQFSEMYVGFGMAYEMSLAGWKFQVMDGVFLSHWGLQRPGHQSANRLRQINWNYERFSCTHLRELVARYDSDPDNMLELASKGCSKKPNLTFVMTATL